MREWVSADFNYTKKPLHKSKKKQREIYNANNARNRDAFTFTKSNQMLKGENLIPVKDDVYKDINKNTTEDLLITIIDLKDQLKE